MQHPIDVQEVANEVLTALGHRGAPAVVHAPDNVEATTTHVMVDDELVITVGDQELRFNRATVMRSSTANLREWLARELKHLVLTES